MSRTRLSLDTLDVEKELLRLDGAKDIEDDRLIKVAKRALREVVAEELSQRQKQFVVLYYYDKHTMLEIAEICEVNVSTVSRTLQRARKNIADRIKYYFIR